MVLLISPLLLFSSKLPRRHHSDPEPLGATKIPNIVSHDSIGATSYCKLKDELVTRIGENWTQPKVHIRFAAEVAEGLNDGIHNALRNT
jgi:hypothetical protein